MMSSESFGAGPLTFRYDAALKFAADAHRNQFRKSGKTPYLSHVLRVSGLVLDYGASEDVAIAALLHDVVEDCGGLPTLNKVRDLFGDEVADIVLETSDSTTDDPKKKAPWRERKEAYVERLRNSSNEAVLISGCDKLDNVTSIIRILDSRGDRSILEQFKGGRDGEFWYWDSIVHILKKKKSPVANELERAVEILREMWERLF